MKKLFLLLTAIITLALSSYAQDRVYHGVVVDSETDEPLVGATVLPIGGGVGTATDLDGKFTLTLPARVRDIKVSYVGYAEQTVRLSDNMVVKMTTDNRLDEVVVTGYGSGKKLGSIVGSVSVVGEEALENVPTATFIDALQGQVSGLSIASSSGDPSSTNNAIRLRGVNSIFAGVTPLFILDGAPVTSAVFTTLNPSDIESITVLKDAASVAIYGSRAANGVIVITSKTGRMNQRARVTVRAAVGWSQRVQDKMAMMNSEEYIRYRDLIGQPVTAQMRYAWETLHIDTDWMKETFNGHAPTYSVEGVVNGGSESLSYYMALGHYSADGIILQSGMRRETLRVNLRSIVNDWLRLGFQSNFGFTKYETNSASNASRVYTNNPMVFARKALPMDSPYYWWIGDDGQVVWGERSMYYHFSQMIDPLLYIKNQAIWRSKVTANMTLWEQLQPINGLTIRAQQNVDAFDYRGRQYVNPTENFTTPMGDTFTWGGSNTGAASQAYQRYYQFTYTNTAEYSRIFNDVHQMTILAGQEAIITRGDNFSVFTEGQTDKRMLLLQQGTEISIDDVSEGMSTKTFNSFFLNGAYNYDEKYFVEATYRRDGSSLFAPDHRWSNFWSIGGMWSIKDESFMQPYKWIDDLKLHVSYGTTGNSSIDNYMYFGLVGQYGTAYNGETATGIAQAANDKLTWETVKSLDLGVNFTLFNSLLSGEINFYNKNTVDMLMSIPYSYTTGFGSGYGNIGSMRNTGIDVDLRANIIRTKDWTWTVRGNFNYNRNRITKLYDGQDRLTLADYGLQFRVGHDSGELYAVRFAGVDPLDGQQMWYDRDGNVTKTFNEEQDAVLTGKSQYAPWSGGFGTILSWKGLSLQLDFNWAAKKYMLNNDRYFSENNNFATDFNQMVSMLNVWTTPGQITNIPAADGQTLQFDTHLIEDASYMRLKNITVQYSLPQNILNKLRLQNLTFHFTGRNLLTFTGYTGYDPEPETNNVVFFYPNTRQYEFGLEVTF